MWKGPTRHISPYDDDDDDDDEFPWFGRLSCKPFFVFAALALGMSDGESGFSLPVPTAYIQTHTNKMRGINYSVTI